MVDQRVYALEVARICEQIRDCVNRPRKQHALVQDAASWDTLCSAMDAVGDTEVALHSFYELDEPKDDGALYLLVYGVLQVLFVQQDAVKNLAEVVGISTTENPLLVEIREIRNDSVGHPTKRGGAKNRKSSFISRASLSNQGFDLMTTYADRSPVTFRRVDLPALIEKQGRELSRVLSEALTFLIQEEEAHKREFEERRMASCLPETTRYALGKLSEAVRREHPSELGQFHLDEVERALAAFRAELEARGLSGALSGVEFTLEEVAYPIQELRTFLENPSSSRLNEKDASIFVFFLSSRYDELREMADEIDADYSLEAGREGS